MRTVFSFPVLTSGCTRQALKSRYITIGAEMSDSANYRGRNVQGRMSRVEMSAHPLRACMLACESHLLQLLADVAVDIAVLVIVVAIVVCWCLCWCWWWWWWWQAVSKRAEWTRGVACAGCIRVLEGGRVVIPRFLFLVVVQTSLLIRRSE